MDCSFENGKGYFRYRAAAIIIEDDCVLMAKNDRDSYYYSVGGGVHLHESAENAVRREVFEETGMKYEVDRLAFVHENFFRGFLGNSDLKCHEIALYFIMKPNGVKIFENRSISQNGANEHVCWLPINNLNEYILYPAFFRDKLLNLKNTVEHIITYE